jgi:DNA polymerase-3 subunit alpha
MSGVDGKTLTAKKFLKIDILATDALDIIQMALKNIKEFEEEDVDIVNIDLKDEKVLDIFREADTMNVFQFETYNFRKLLEEAHIVEFENLVQLNALNRPTPLSVGYHLKYLDRCSGKDYGVAKLLKKHLKSTFGLLLYQEQTNEILADWLDVNIGEADNIRRDLEKIGFEEIMEPYRKQLYSKYGRDDVDEAFDELKEVVGYAFNKSHSCAYAYIAFQMAYLKAYYRKYFNLAVLNSETDEDKINTMINDCDKHDIQINAFDINEASLHFSINKKGEIVPGARILKGVGEKSILAIIEHKPYKDFKDFTERAVSITPKGNTRKIPSNILRVLFDNEFFENGWGKTENQKVSDFLDKAAEKKAKKKEKTKIDRETGS